MLALRIHRPGEELRAEQIAVPEPGTGQVLLRVAACAVCRTDLHIIDGELPHARLPVVPGHEIVGRVVARGAGAERFGIGERVGVPWLGWTCGRCRFCTSGRENLCREARFTGCHHDGGFAQYALADERYCFELPVAYDDASAAPLLCAGLIGHRSLRAAGDAQRLGLYGFGAAAHIAAQVARFEGRRVFAFTRPGDSEAQAFARELGAEWAGGSHERAPEELDAAILYAPIGELVPIALAAVAPGGSVVCAGIHMSDIPSFPYALLWGERALRSVANLTRRDGEEFFTLAQRAGVRTEVERFALRDGGEALARLRSGQLRGAAVLIPEGAS
jgi:propanol-preferring alcohol dehydrogenase